MFLLRLLIVLLILCSFCIDVVVTSSLSSSSVSSSEQQQQSGKDFYYSSLHIKNKNKTHHHKKKHPNTTTTTIIDLDPNDTKGDETSKEIVDNHDNIDITDNNNNENTDIIIEPQSVLFDETKIIQQDLQRKESKLNCPTGQHTFNISNNTTTAPDTIFIEWNITTTGVSNSNNDNNNNNNNDYTIQTIRIEIIRKWSPIGVDRFYQLILDNYYNCAAFFRVVPGKLFFYICI